MYRLHHGMAGASARPMLGCPLSLPGKGHQCWGVPCHCQGRATMAGGSRRDEVRLARSLWGAGSDAAEHMNSWNLPSLWHICIQKQEFNQFAFSWQARCNPCPFILNKSIGISPSSHHGTRMAVTGEHRAHSSDPGLLHPPRLAATHPTERMDNA